MNSLAPHRIKSLLAAAVAAAGLTAAVAHPATAAAKSAYGVKIGPSAELRYTAVDFQLENVHGADATVHAKVTYKGHVLGKGELGLESDSTDWKGIWSTKYGRSLKLHGLLKSKVTGYTTFGDGVKHPFSQKLNVYSGTKKWNGVYKATNGLVFKVKDGFGYDLSYGTLAYCTKSASNTNAFYMLPFDQLPVIIHDNGSFSTKGHIDTGKIMKFQGQITKSHKLKGYASWTWINIFYGDEPGDYDYCATGGKFHGKRVSTKVRSN